MARGVGNLNMADRSEDQMQRAEDQIQRAQEEDRILRVWTPVLLRTILIVATVILVIGLFKMITESPGYTFSATMRSRRVIIMRGKLSRRNSPVRSEEILTRSPPWDCWF
jgi:hypothetical protein